MLSQLIRKEILQHLMSLRFAIACVLCLVVILCSILIRCRDYSQALDDYNQDSAMAKQRLDGYATPLQLVIEVYRKPNPLKVFVRGLRDTGVELVRITPQERMEPGFPDPANPAALLFPATDLVTFVGVIMSLLAIVFGYDAVCGEKQRGTLRLMLSYSVPRHLILISKWIGGYVTLVLPFLLTTFAAVVLVTVRKDVSLTSAQWGQVGVILGMALLYLAAVYSLAIYVSCLTRQPAASVMLLLCVWVVLVLAVPNLSPHIAGMIRPAQEVLDAEEQRLAKEKEIHQRITSVVLDWQAKHGFGKDWWKSIFQDEWSRRKKIYELQLYVVPIYAQEYLAMLKAWEKIDEPRRLQVDAQIRLSRWIGRISPFTCFAMSAAELADGGVIQQRKFRAQLLDFQADVTNYMAAEYVGILKAQIASRGAPVDWRRNRQGPVPVFRYAPPAGRDYVRAAAVDAGIMAGMAVILFMLSHAAFRRYDVR